MTRALNDSTAAALRVLALPILTIEEAAVLLRVTADWLQRSTCPRLKVGGVVRWDRDLCLSWFRAHSTLGMR